MNRLGAPASVLVLLIVQLSAIVLPAASQDTANRQTAETCAEALPQSIEACQTIATLLQRSMTGFGGGAGRQALTPLTIERTQPPDPSQLARQLPLLRWDPRAPGFQTSIPSGSCWLEAMGSILRCAFDFAGNQARAVERFDELRAVVQQLAPADWAVTTRSRAMMWVDGQVVRVSLHRVNFAAANWVDDSPTPRWKLLMSLGRLGTQDEISR